MFAPFINVLKAEQIKPILIREQGFTLIELMLSLTLGLVVSTAAFQLFTHSMVTQKIQLSMSEIQDTAVFGFSALKREIAHANLGSSRSIRQQSAWTGVVFTGSEDSPEISAEGKVFKTGNLRGVTGMEPNLVTKNNVGPSNLILPLKSDQLTIQYRAAFDSYDCEGRTVNQGDMIIERYFTRIDNQRNKNEAKALAIVLACDAGSYQLIDGLGADSITADRITKDIMTLKNFGDNGVVLINRVDYFSVKLGVKLEQGVAYIPIEIYLDKQAADYIHDVPVVAIQVGIIGRGSSSIGSASDKAGASTFSLHGNELKIREKTPNYIRRTLQTVVILRNSHSQ